jgi:hypothetical protein
LQSLLYIPFFFHQPNKKSILNYSNYLLKGEIINKMNEQELRSLISNGKITMESDEIILDDSYISKKEFIKGMKQYCRDSKENFNEYRKDFNGQKRKDKRRKCK